MACYHQTRKLGLTCYPTGLQNSVDCILVYFWPEMGTTSTAFVADVLHKLPCPFNEKAPVETDLPFCTTSQLRVIALNVLVIFFFFFTYTAVALSHIFIFVSIFLEIVSIVH
jgi:hypothetical protein